jgi:hypothetical protein
MTDNQLYNAIWEVVARHVGDTTEADEITDHIWDILMEDDQDITRQRSYNQTAGFMMSALYPFK